MADTDTVKVGCTRPGGMRLRVYEWVGEGAGRTLQEVGAFDLAGSSDGRDAFTSVPADLWAKWLALNSESDLVRGGEIFAQGYEHG